MRLISELKRRNVLRMAALYVVAAWLIMQVGGVLIDLGNLPDSVGPVILLLLIIGFPIALVFSWFYELTPAGITLEKESDAAESIDQFSGRRLDFIVISLLCAAVILFAYDKWWTGPAPDKSIAVLSFANRSGDPDLDYFSDGISEDLLNLLARVPGLRVVSRSSSFSFKGKDVDIPSIAAQLNVTHVLDGSVRRVGDQVRITAQLIDARTDSHVWSRPYDRELNDIFAVQDEISAAIGDALKLKLALAEGEPVRPTIIRAANFDAYDAYLEGRELIYLRGSDNMKAAVRQLTRAVRLDDEFAPAHAQLAIATTLQAIYEDLDREAAVRIAVQHLDRAQELEPDLAEAHGGRALLAQYLDGDPEDAISHALQALAVNPSYMDAMNWLGIAYASLGRYKGSAANLERMMVMDPLSVIGGANYAEWLSMTGRYDEAHEVADQLIVQSPWIGYRAHSETSLFYEGRIAEGLSWGLQWNRAANYDGGNVKISLAIVGEYDEVHRLDPSGSAWLDLYDGRYDRVIAEAQSMLELEPDNEFFTWSLAEFLYSAGRFDEALPYFERLLALAPEGRPMASPVTVFSSPTEIMMRLAHTRRELGDGDGAQEAADIAKLDHAARLEAGEKNQYRYRTEAMIAAFENDPDRAIAALSSAVRHGMRDSLALSDRLFDDLWEDRRFTELQEDLDEILVLAHDDVLQLICFNNPTPDHWQPMPETCEGIEERRSP